MKNNQILSIVIGIGFAVFLILFWRYIELQRQIAVANCINQTIDNDGENRADHIGVCNYLQTGKSDWLGTWTTPKI